MKDSTFEKYKLVIDEYLVNGMNGTKAYQKFYTDSSEENAAVRFHDLVRNSKIQSYLKERQQDAQETLKITHQDVLKELYNWAYSDITETMLLSPEEVKELPENIRRLITKFKHTKKTIGSDDGAIYENVVELWFVSKEKAIDMINRHLGFYEKDNEQSGKTQIIQFELPDNKR